MPSAHPLSGHTQGVTSVGFSPDGQRAISGSSDSTALEWPTPDQGAWPELLCHKITQNMSRQEWSEWVSPAIDYISVCPGLPTPPDASTR